MLFCWFSKLSSQTPLSFKEPTTSSPTAAGFQKFIDIPVSNHTGVPNISIPIHTVVEGPLSTSISLNYNSSGIKVDELASWVGLGWSMTAQGMISRSVQGREDENGFLLNPGIHSIFNTGACATNPNCVDGPAPCPCTSTMAYLLEGTRDAEPDIFSFSFGGYSGKFVFGADQQIHLLSQQDIKITYNYENDFDKWLAVTPDGTKYYFGKTFGRDAKEYSTGNGSSNFAIQSTSWYLTRIESADAIYWIDFFYATEANDEYSRMGHSMTVATQGSTDFTESTPKVTQTFLTQGV